MSRWDWALFVVPMVGLAVLIANEVRVWKRSRQRRGGVLELDTPEARAVIGVDPDDWLAFVDLKRERASVGVPILATPMPEGRQPFVEMPTPLRRCNPARGVHYYGNGVKNPCQCGEHSTVASFLPLTGGDEAA